MSMPLEELPNSHRDTRSLEKMVQRYARDERPRYGRVIEPVRGADTALRELLMEIDQTMLPRRICVQCPPHEDLLLYVSNRRLFDIKTRGEPHAPVPKSPKEAAQVFASLLRDATRNTTGIIVQKPHSLAHFDDVGMSVSTALLAHNLGVRDEGQPVTPAQDVGADFASIRDAAFASVLATPWLSFSQPRGPEQEIAPLQVFWRDHVKRANLEATRGRIRHQSQECFVAPIDGDMHLIVATKDQENWCLALVPHARLQALTVSWGGPMSGDASQKA